jgi:hypothetical protein
MNCTTGEAVFFVQARLWIANLNKAKKIVQKGLAAEQIFPK